MNTETQAAEQPAVFSREGEFTIPLKRLGKSVTCRFPSDEEVCRRQAKIKTMMRRHGADGSITETDGEEAANAAMLDAIREPGDELDEAEAGIVINRLLRAEADEPEREGEGFAIPIRVVGGILTRHVLRVPSQKELQRYQRNAVSVIERRHFNELKIAPQSFGSFYDSLALSTEGYDEGGVPLAHKIIAVRELVAAVRAIDDEDDPENFN